MSCASVRRRDAARVSRLWGRCRHPLRANPCCDTLTGMVPVVVLAWIPVVLGLDRGASLTEQRLLGVGTWLLLVALLWRESPRTRAQVLVVVAFATAVEYCFADWLGVYTY